MKISLALIAALGLVISAPVFAADEDTSAPVVKATDAGTTADATKSTKGTKITAKDKTAAKDATTTDTKGTKITAKDKLAKKDSKGTTTAATGKTDAKSPKAAADSDLAPSAGGTEKTDTKN